MSDTTPRPDETPSDPTAPPADPAWQPPPPPAEQPAFAGATPGTAVATPNALSPSEERTTGVLAHGVALAATVISGGFLGFVAVLAGYDLLRRTTCIGDPLGLGGPGFGEKMANGNVMTPQCKIVKAKHVVRARG